MGSPKRRAKPTCRCLTCGSRAIAFGSLTEADHYFSVLRFELESGVIRPVPKPVRRGVDLRFFHPTFKLPGGVLVIADNAYERCSGGRWALEVIDVKSTSGHLTQKFKRNRKMVRAVHGIDIVPVQHKIKR